MLEADPSLLGACNREDGTPLDVASAVRSPELVCWLLERGAPANRRGQDGRTPLDLAVDGRSPIDAGQFAAVAGMLRSAGAELTPRAAVALNKKVWLRARHAKGTLENPVTWEAGGLLTVAVRHNTPDMLALLLDFGFDPNERVSSGEGDWVAYSQGYPLWNCAALGRRVMDETPL